MKRALRRGMTAAVDVLLPRQCIVCGERLHTHEDNICLSCLADFPLTRFWEQSRNIMADKLNALIQNEIQDGETEPYAFAAALFLYSSEADYRKIPYQIKYHGNIRAGRCFGSRLGKFLAGSESFRDVDMVIPVPLHWTRRWKRGYNQAEVIARAVAAGLPAVVRCDILRRTRRTKTQTKVDVEDKTKNVSGAFEAADPGLLPRHVLIIDDTFTTGATLFACFKALRAVFPTSVRISVATLGYVGH
ncbi:MAG: ComF family protein [Bacteroidales bacterium]|nr:ComF family protein [Bacteroidales bacterium]